MSSDVNVPGKSGVKLVSHKVLAAEDGSKVNGVAENGLGRGDTTKKMSGAKVNVNGEEASAMNGEVLVDKRQPSDVLEEISVEVNCAVTSREFALRMDERDAISSLRNKFFYPKIKDLPNVDVSLPDVHGDDDCMYLCGNSLGLLPRTTEKYIKNHLESWGKLGVHGHMHGNLPFAFADEHCLEGTCRLVGAKPEEIAIMNSLSVNLHVMLVSFYRPTKTRYKIVIEGKAFPSDHYVVESQIKFHGLQPSECMVCLRPSDGEYILRDEDILSYLEANSDDVALVLLSGVQFYTGQLFDMASITTKASEKGCVIGWDLAHAVGNVELNLHDWGVDFACWCSYKYLNAGAGAIGGVFVHVKHSGNDYPRLTGWWSHKMSTRFKMDNVLDLSEGASGYRISNPSAVQACCLLGSLEVFAETDMKTLTSKSFLLTGYLEYLIKHHFSRSQNVQDKQPYVTIITPSDPSKRGVQLSLLFSIPIKRLFQELQLRGVVCDEREPNVIRIAPAPLYCSYLDVYRFIQCLDTCLKVVASDS